MNDPTDGLVLAHLWLPPFVLDILEAAADDRGITLDGLVMEGLAAALCGCHRQCITLCDT